MTGAAVATTTPQNPRSMLSKQDADGLTQEIRTGFQDAYDRFTNVAALLLEVRDRRGWEAMGYRSFEQYLNTEFPKARSHAYRMMDRAMFEDAVGLRAPIKASHARILKPRAAEIRERLAEAPASEHPSIVEEAVREELALRVGNREPQVVDVQARPATRPPDVIADRDPDDVLAPGLEPTYAPAPEQLPAGGLSDRGYTFERLVEVLDWLASLPDADEIVRTIPEGESHQVASIHQAYRWICDFADAWRSR